MESPAGNRPRPHHRLQRRRETTVTTGVDSSWARVLDGEENVLCYARDGYDRGENNLVHELAHNIKLQGLQTLDATFGGRVKTAFDVAHAQGKYQGLYAGKNPEEY